MSQQQCQHCNSVRRSSSQLDTADTAASSAPPSPTQLLPQLQEPQSPDEYCVVNFYHLVDIEDPKEMLVQHQQYVQQLGLDIRGRIYISPQGMNCQYGGTVAHATAYAEMVKQQPGFQGLRYSVWPATGHSFPKLRLKYKPNLISLAGGMQSMPITDPHARATPLEPEAWRDMIAQAKERGVVVLDVRNDYEWDAGHFEGAERPAEEVFHETPVGEEHVPQPLQGLSKDTPVMMYCTGGIRCDVYSPALRAQGFTQLYTLEGGIQNYLRRQGGAHWKGSLFVFDARMAIPGGNTTSSAAAAGSGEAAGLPAAVPCQVCGSPDSQLPHVNCANIDCNELFIACAACKARLQGCCCESCMAAPRLLRPAKVDGGHYGEWGNYAEHEAAAPLMSSGRTREGRVARRARRREVLKSKREDFIAERLARKQMMRDAMARIEALEMQPREQEGAQQPASSSSRVPTAVPA